MEPQSSQSTRAWTVYGCKHVRRGDFGPREWALEPPANSCSECEEVPVAPVDDRALRRGLAALMCTDSPENRRALRRALEGS